MAKASWLFVAFGKSQSAVLDLADWIARRPCSEPRLPDSSLSKEVNFYPYTHVYGLVRGWFTSRSNHVTTSDEDPGGRGGVWTFPPPLLPCSGVWKWALPDGSMDDFGKA
jgi:hypothetical protein